MELPASLQQQQQGRVAQECDTTGGRWRLAIAGGRWVSVEYHIVGGCRWLLLSNLLHYEPLHQLNCDQLIAVEKILCTV